MTRLHRHTNGVLVPRRDPVAGHTSCPSPCPSPSSGSVNTCSPTPPPIASLPTSMPPSSAARPSAPSPMSSVRVSLSTLRDLTPLAFDDGRSQLLLCVHGLLPIAYRGVSYNIPMAFWITRDYPRHPPIAYVVPTNNILVRAGKHVDVSGRCCSDYIQNWERKDEVRCVRSAIACASSFSGLQSVRAPRIAATALLQ